MSAEIYKQSSRHLEFQQDFLKADPYEMDADITITEPILPPMRGGRGAAQRLGVVNPAPGCLP
jgi:hypothetical protein